MMRPPPARRAHPVIVGAAQMSGAQSTNEAALRPSDPITLMAQALHRAALDTGASGLLAAVGLTAVVGGLWRLSNPAALVAGRLGIDPGRTMLTDFGGQVPVALLADLSERISDGELDVAVVLGGECNATRRALAELGQRPSTPDDGDRALDEFWGEPLVMGDEIAIKRGADQPRVTYAVLDSAIRVARGESLAQAQLRAARICSSFSSVAATNPHASIREPMSADEVLRPGLTNRMVCWPYTKAMCANNTVDHAGAIIVCSDAAADRLSISPRKRVYVHATSLGADSPTLAERIDVARAPGLRAASAAICDAAGGVDAVDHLDLYCCFPSMVTLTAEALGVGLERSLTTSGGLGMAGAPINFAAGEGMIAMVHRLRTDPLSAGIVQANGGHASKHAFALLSARTPAEPYRLRRTSSQSAIRVVAPGRAAGLAVVDGITVDYDAAGATRAIALVRFEDGSRTWVNSTDVEVMRSVTEIEWVGRRVMVAGGVLAAGSQL